MLEAAAWRAVDGESGHKEAGLGEGCVCEELLAWYVQFSLTVSINLGAEKEP